MSKKSDADRWDSKLATFVKSYGVVPLSRELNVVPSAIYHWIRGKTSPHPSKALALQRLAKLAGTPISLDEIYSHFKGVRSERYTDPDETDNQTHTGALTAKRATPKSRGAR